MRRATLWMPLEEWKAKAQTDAEAIKGYALQKICDDLQIKQVSEADRTMRFVISTQNPDRDKDTLSVAGWKLDSFIRNPVIPFAHDYGSLPVAKALDIAAEKQALVSTAQFVSKEIYPFADTVYQMLQQGFLNAVSVGFRPMKHEVNKDRGGIDFLQQELLEYSVVPVPANPEALVEARSLGIDVGPLKEWAEQVLDEMHGEAMICVPKESLEQMVKVLRPTQVTVEDTPLKSSAELAAEKNMAAEVDTEEDTVEQLWGEVAETILPANEEKTEEVREEDGFTPWDGPGVKLPHASGDSMASGLEQKVNPTALQQPLPESYEWVTQQLMQDVTGFLTRNGVEVREGLDIVIPISTFVDSLVFCLLGRDRPFEEDPCYQGAYKRDRRLGGVPRFKGEPEQVDIQVTMELVQASRVAADFKQEVTKAAQPEIVDFLAGNVEDIRDCLDTVLVTTVQKEVRDRVSETIRALRGRVD